MNRRSLLAALVVVSVLPATQAFADYADDIVEALQRQGYKSIKVMRTLLGRTRIVATDSNGTRELIINPRTGEILRDVSVDSRGNTTSDANVLDSGGSTSGNDNKPSSGSNNGSSDTSGGGDNSENAGSGDNGHEHGDGKED